MNNDFIHYSHLCLRLFLDTGSSNRPNSGHEKGETVTTFSGYNFYEPIISIFTPFYRTYMGFYGVVMTLI